MNNQKLKGLLVGWKNISKSFRDRGLVNEVIIMENCISDLDALLLISEKNEE